MAEYTVIGPQTVEDNSPVLFSNMTISGGCQIMHREGSGLFTLFGPDGCPCRGRIVQITVGANVSIPTGGTAGPITTVLAINGEPDLSTKMVVTPAAVSELQNISRTINVLVPGGSTTDISLVNRSGVDVVYENVTIDFNIVRR